MNSIKKFLFIGLLITIGQFTHAQMTISVNTMRYFTNNQPIPNCGLINFGGNATVKVIYTAFVNHIPNSTQSGRYKFYIKPTLTATPVLIDTWEAFGWIPVWGNGVLNPPTYWILNDNYMTTVLTASNFSGAGRFYVVYHDDYSNTDVKSCEYTVNNLPVSNSISPASLTLGCGANSPIAFTVTDANNYPGTWSYNWNVGNGWIYNGSPVSGIISTSSNTITLTPSSNPLSNIVVTPVLNGVSQTALTTVVNYTAMSNSATMSGNATICTSGTYSLTGVIAGQSVAWSSSNPSAASLSATSGTSTTLTKTGGGATTLTATISNACGQSYTVSKSLYIGAPLPFGMVRASNENCNIKYHNVPFEIPQRSPLLTYTFNAIPIPGMNASSSSYNGVTQYVFHIPKNWTGELDFTCVASNTCGTSSNYTEEFIVNNCNILPQTRSSTSAANEEKNASFFKVYPNPAHDFVAVDLNDENLQPEKNNAISAEIFDVTGQSKGMVKITDSKATIDVTRFSTGVYILKINTSEGTESHQFIVK